MKAREIMHEYLVTNHYDGLVDTDGECACGLEDLMPCGEDFGRCMPGYEVEGCSEYCGKGCDFHIVEGERPE